MVIVALSTEFRDVVYVTFRIEKPGLSPRTVITLQTPEKKLAQHIKSVSNFTVLRLDYMTINL